MKVMARAIKMIAWFAEDGTPNPVRFKIKNDDESESVIKVDRVISKEFEKLAGNKMILFRCQSVLNDVNKLYELKYEINTCKWMLYKM